jgi:hypothetical protein
MSIEPTPINGGPLDGEGSCNTGEQFTHRVGDVIHVYEWWPCVDGDGVWHYAGALQIGPQRLTQGDT